MNGKIWFTSDTHFGHSNIIKYCSRPFIGVDHMDGALVKGWNERVAPEDTVYHLGDFSFLSADASARTCSRLNGIKHLILGNHDRSAAAMLKVGFTSVQKFKRIDISESGVGDDVYLVHDPADAVGVIAPIVFCGHVHEKWKVKKMEREDRVFVNVGVDQWGFAPVSLEELLTEVEK